MRGSSDQKLTANAAHVWRFPLIATRQEIKALTHWLSRRERDAVARLTRPAERDKRIVASGRLRYILSRYVDCAPDAIDIERTAAGRPQLVASAASNIQFSLAHSGNLGLVGIGTCAIGVDIERVRSTKGADRLAARFFSRREVEEMSRRCVAERVEWFFRQWVLKEAYLKSIGAGVPAGLSQCEIEWGKSGPSIRNHGAASKELSRTILELPVSRGYAAALSVSPSLTDVSVFDL